MKASAHHITALLFDLDDDHAFQMLVHSSQTAKFKLVEVARWLTSAAGRRSTRPSVPPHAAEPR